MITGINHCTLAVSDLEVSFRFYVDVLGLEPVARWSRGAYLVAGGAWVALALDSTTRSSPLPEETHIAFSVASGDFQALADRIRAAGATEWRENRSEGASHYFLDPDGHKLEIHVGTLGSRTAALEAAPPAEMTWFQRSEDRPTLDSQTDAPRNRHQTFPARELRREMLSPDPLAQFERWLEEAVRGGDMDPYAMTFTTADSEGTPSARTVVLKDVDPRGFIFTSRYDGPKGRELRANPVATLVFYWPMQGRQVRISGGVEKVSEEESARYFRVRPRESRLALLAFPQSRPVTDRATLERRLAELSQSFDGRDIPMPDWGGYVLRPHSVEFWQGSSERLHDRFRYMRTDDGTWTIERLTP